MEEHRFILVIALNYLVAPKGAIVVLGEVATHHLHLTQTLRRASEQRSHPFFLFSCSACCPFFLQGGQEAQTPSCSIPLHPLWAAAVAALRVTVELRLVLLWKFGGPSLHSPAFHHLARRMLLSFRSPAFFFLLHLSSSCRFSTWRRFVAASQRFILRWKNLLRSSFFFSTPVVQDTLSITQMTIRYAHHKETDIRKGTDLRGIQSYRASKTMNITWYCFGEKGNYLGH